MTSALPGTRPARQSFPPPVPTEKVPEPTDGTPAERAHAIQSDVAQQYSQWRDAHSPDIDPEILKANAGAFTQVPSVQQLAPALKAVEADAIAARRNRDDAVAAVKVAPEAEARAQRVWARTVRLLDSKMSPADVAGAARDLIAQAQPDDLPVLAEELSAYLKFRNAPSDWLDAALAAVVPEAAEADAAARLKDRQLAVIRGNHDRLTHAITKDVAPPPLQSPAGVTGDKYTNPAL